MWWAWLSHFFNVVMFRILGLGRPQALTENQLEVYVSVNRSQVVQVIVDKKSSIADIKKDLANQLSKPCHQIRIILAGHELPDTLVLEDSDIGQQTVLHAINVDVDSIEHGAQSGPQQEQVTVQDDDAEDTPGQMSIRSHFYVFCSDPCDSLQPGKLRVRCQGCHNGAILVHRDPQDWNDVLGPPGRITGSCKADGCPNTDADANVIFFFKCANHSPSTEETTPLNLVKPNLHKVPCLACLSEDSDLVVVFECQDRHVICVPCFQEFCLSKLNERQFVWHSDFGYTLGCPIGCDNSLIAINRHFKLLGKDAYERYQRFGAEEFVLGTPGGILCPQPNCGMGILQDEPCRKVTCGSCHFVFCRSCLDGYHVDECGGRETGASTMATPISNLRLGIDPTRSKWVDPSSVTIAINTKPCPKCRTPTEKADGCMHMVCTMPRCGFQWCWICQTEWTRDCMGLHWFG